MRDHNDQATLETALSWLGIGMMALLLVLIPVIVLIPAPAIHTAAGTNLINGGTRILCPPADKHESYLYSTTVFVRQRTKLLSSGENIS